MRKCNYLKGILLGIFAGAWISSTAFAENVDIKTECENEGYAYCESGSAALKMAEDYLDDVCWDDKTGINVAYPGEDVSGKIEIKSNHGISDRYQDFIYDVQVSNDKTTFHGMEYNILTVKRCAYETHFYGITRQQALEADAVADEVVRKCDAQSTLDKISYVYNYLCDNVSYDTSYEAGSIYDALVGGRTVCSGYASAFQVMMEKMGIPCRIMAGRVNGMAHAWNAVNVLGKWYYVDATFANTMGMRAEYLLFGSDRRADVYGIGVDSGDYGNEEMVLEDDTAEDVDDNGGEADKSCGGDVIMIVIAAGVLVAGVVGLLAFLKVRKSKI